jgi:two-component system nitrate/nitrite sensor histidine kinase NarX
VQRLHHPADRTDRADAGSVRLVDFKRGRLELIAQQGLPLDMLEHDDCAPIDGCLCGDAVQQPVSVIHRFDQLPKLEEKHCQRAGFASISVFHIRHNQNNVGIFTLYFYQQPQLTAQDQFLLETLGSHLGVAVENQRLAARDRQFAVAEERNLMAQGLHDSIAQSLSFLNLQVQMLEAALADKQTEQAQENLACIRAGVQECYEDVRELLLNFRTRINKEDFADAVRTLLDRFEKQARVPTQLSLSGNGLALDPQQQLQVIFILQEALSNVRKHAHARRVRWKFATMPTFAC